MSNAKVISLAVKPYQVSHLCFDVDGIVYEVKAKLGMEVKEFMFSNIYNLLDSKPTLQDYPARLLYNSGNVNNYVYDSALAILRGEDRAVLLDRAITARENAYFTKYANSSNIISAMNEYYSPVIAGSKIGRLATLKTLANEQQALLAQAYANDGRTGVVRGTETSLYSQMNTNETSEQPGPERDVDTFSSGSANQTQTISTKDYAYRIPYFECAAQNERAQISLTDEYFAQFMYTQSFPNLSTIFSNELAMIDSDVQRLQLAYLATYLMSPIRGTVTGVYKNPGDAVRAGEPVVRVENNYEVFLLATLVYRGLIAVGSTVMVETKLFDSSSPVLQVKGTVVSARGRSRDDQWDAVIRCVNVKEDLSGLFFPLNYHFDYDDTTLSIG